MFFSPITERSAGIRTLYLALYLLLSLGALTMVIPFVIMLSGSVEPGRRLSEANIVPAYLFDDSALWTRYVRAKYRNKGELLRMAWNDPKVDFENLPAPVTQDSSLTLWREWLANQKPAQHLFGLGFSDVTIATPYYYNRQFQRWLEQRYQTIDALNQQLDTTFKSFTGIRPPNLILIGSSTPKTPFLSEFFTFCESVPRTHTYAWDAGSFYRAVFLPRTMGPDIAAFNQKYATTFGGYGEVPFSSTAPSIAADSWELFVTKLLSPDFVDFTPIGQQRFASSALSKGDFLRTQAKAEDVRVVSADCLFADWGLKTHGLVDLRIPQREIDAVAFREEANFWRRVFLFQNYQYVLDEILINGRALRNTALLVVFMIVGTLTVNPLAAYALSRFKLRQGYYLLLFFLATIAFPAEVTMIPTFLQLKELNLLNTFGALVLPSLANGFSIFLLKGFFDSLPKELYEAAELDGASEWKMFWLIAMNLSKPILAVNVLAAFVSAYGAFFYALILAPDPKLWTIMVYIYQLQQLADPPVVYASLIIVAIPTLLIFVLCQNIILRGIVVPAEK